MILNLGASHLENFTSLEEICMAKREIRVEAKPRDDCILNADNPLTKSLPMPSEVKKASVVLYHICFLF